MMMMMIVLLPQRRRRPVPTAVVPQQREHLDDNLAAHVTRLESGSANFAAVAVPTGQECNGGRLVETNDAVVGQ